MLTIRNDISPRIDQLGLELPRVLAAALLASLLAACAHTHHDAAPADQLLGPGPIVEPGKEPFTIFSGGAAGRLLTRHMTTMVDFSEGAARRHRVSRAWLLGAPEDTQQQMLSEAVAAYARLPEPSYGERWLTVSVLADLERSESLDFLSEIALAEIPPERLSQLDPHASSRGEELAIRLATVRGISRLASRGNPAADMRLLEIVSTSPHRALAVRAIHGFLHAPLYQLDRVPLDQFHQSDEYRRRLTVVRGTLPPEMRDLLEVRPLSRDLAPTPPDVIEAIRTPIVGRVSPIPGLFQLPPETSQQEQDHE
ncbi:MAG: hypothetical protein GY719_12305 [bacterium]|nr:hypothetical protein [bacterium]